MAKLCTKCIKISHVTKFKDIEMKTCATIVQSLSLPTLLCLQFKNKFKFLYIIIPFYISKITMNTQLPHNNKIIHSYYIKCV